MAAAHETTATLSAIAGKRAIAVAGLQPDDIDVILVATLTPDYWMPSTGALVKEAIGNTRAAAMDVMAACSGFVYAYSVADAYHPFGHVYKNALVIGAETLTRFLDFSDRGTCILFGDGAGAVVLSASDEEGGGMQGLEMTTDPDGAYMIWLPSGGSRSPVSRRDARPRRALRAHGRQGDVSLCDQDHGHDRARRPSSVPAGSPRRSTCSSRTRPTCASSSRSPRASTCRWTRCSSTSIATATRPRRRCGIALAEAVDSGRIKVGDKIVLVAFGAGLTSAVASRSSGRPIPCGQRALSGGARRQRAEPIDWASVDPIPERLRSPRAGPARARSTTSPRRARACPPGAGIR